MAISVDPVEESLELAEKQNISFPLLSDPDMRAISAYGVRDSKKDIAIPAVFIVGQDGVVLWKHVGESIANRPSVKKLLKVIDAVLAN